MMRPTADKAPADLQQTEADLLRRLAEAERRMDAALRDREEAQLQQAAATDILKIISAAAGDVTAVFDAILARAIRLCGAVSGHFRLYDGKGFPLVAVSGAPDHIAQMQQRANLDPGPLHPASRLLRGEDIVHLPDTRDTDVYREDIRFRSIVDGSGANAMLAAALRKNGALLGYLNVYRRDAGAFSHQQISLLQTFAAQAVIAMENARLINQTREALEQQTATAEVLEVINASPGELTPVFDAMLERAVRLSGAAFGMMNVHDGTQYRIVALRGVPPELARIWSSAPPRPGPHNALTRMLNGEDLVHIEDLAGYRSYHEGDARTRALVEVGGARSLLAVALRKEGTFFGTLTAYRKEVRPFSDRQIALMQNFAAQAVIAMENARLITETREALERQTATAEVLRIINASPGRLEPVFDVILGKARDLCGATLGSLQLFEDGQFRAVATRGMNGAMSAFLRRGYRPSALSTLSIAHSTQVMDAAEVARQNPDDPVWRATAELGGIRTLLAVPLVKDGRFLGRIIAARHEVRAFTDKQIALLENFAAQAVIAMENARLIVETREALELQQASAEILNVISTSVADAHPVFEKIVDSGRRLFRDDALDVFLMDDNGVLQAAPVRDGARSPLLSGLPAAWESTAVAPAIRDRRLAHYPDVAQDPLAPQALRDDAAAAGHRAVAVAPMMGEGRPLGVLAAGRPRGAFSARELAILQGFADQAAIAIRNARMFHQVSAARDVAETALRELKVAQAGLVHAEKMASLGQLTAGIAHEIKNPLNFVNNFAALSVELLGEVGEAMAPALAALEADRRADVDETMGLLTGNLQKIAEHGRRADGIVKSMLLHSRGGSGERQAADLNQLLDEALNLAFHGARAQDQNFNVTLERDLDAALQPLDVVPQDLTRVFLNLIGNGFHALKIRQSGDAGFRPLLTVATRDRGASVEVRIRDNGTGITPEVRARLFQPFFTTKPTGEGTGLGLSISYDIVTQAHGGRIEVESEAGNFTEFTVCLPRNRVAT